MQVRKEEVEQSTRRASSICNSKLLYPATLPRQCQLLNDDKFVNLVHGLRVQSHVRTDTGCTHTSEVGHHWRPTGQLAQRKALSGRIPDCNYLILIIKMQLALLVALLVLIVVQPSLGRHILDKGGNDRATGSSKKCGSGLTSCVKGKSAELRSVRDVAGLLLIQRLSRSRSKQPYALCALLAHAALGS